MLGDYELEMPDNAWHTHDIRREGQPISTDEFLRKLALGWKVAPTANDFQERACLWLLGDFAEAMEGLK